MKPSIGTLFALASVALTACSGGGLPAEAVSEPLLTNEEARVIVERMNEAWDAAVLAGDFEASAAMYAVDAIRMQPGMPPLVGRDAIRTWLEGQAETYTFDGSNEIQEVRALSPDWILVRSTGTFTTTPRTGGEPSVQSEKWLTLAQRRAGETWEWFRDAGSSDLPQRAQARDSLLVGMLRDSVVLPLFGYGSEAWQELQFTRSSGATRANSLAALAPRLPDRWYSAIPTPVTAAVRVRPGTHSERSLLSQQVHSLPAQWSRERAPEYLFDRAGVHARSFVDPAQDTAWVNAIQSALRPVFDSLEGAWMELQVEAGRTAWWPLDASQRHSRAAALTRIRATEGYVWYRMERVYPDEHPYCHNRSLVQGWLRVSTTWPWDRPPQAIDGEVVWTDCDYKGLGALSPAVFFRTGGRDFVIADVYGYDGGGPDPIVLSLGDTSVQTVAGGNNIDQWWRPSPF